MRMGRPQIILVSGLGVALFAAGGVIVFQSRKLAEFQQQREADLQTLRQTREALRQSELRGTAALVKPQSPARDAQAAIAQRDATIDQLNQAISEARSNITQLQSQISGARDEDQKALTGANQRYQKLEADSQSRLDAIQKELSDTQVGLQDSRRRIRELEKTNAKLASETSANALRGTEREQILANLQDLDRRRESYLTSIQDRYRDITTRFRTMTGMLNSPRNDNSTAFSGAALDLIQNAISLTDNDLQHLSELNAQAFRLEKKLQKK